LNIRRVVTGHDAQGKAIVAIDEVSKDLVSNRKGAQFVNIWSTSGFPVDNTDPADAAKQISGTTREDGTVFRVIEYAPGVAPRNHRTHSMDYAVVLSGEIDMVMDGETVHLRAGDVLVQRGTIHDWVNSGKEPCVIAFVLVSAKPVVAGGKALAAGG
jgi:mannose-6-phosphate isomerase-like protein (cupin superfamily)